MKEEVISETILWNAVEALVEAISARNHTDGHSIRVAEYAVRLARAIGVQSAMVEQIRLGALLHDIGQICWPDDLLCKQGAPLTEEERKIIESHTYKGVELLRDWPSLGTIRPYVLYHQELIQRYKVSETQQGVNPCNKQKEPEELAYRVTRSL
jgi:putative nucleotidyltransferase with HDIG domain